MFQAFAEGDVEKFVATVSSDTLWVYHGTQIIVVSELEFIDNHRIVFIDDRNDIPIYQGENRIPGIEVTLAVIEITPCDQDLRDLLPMASE